MILKPDDARQMFFTSRLDLVAGEELVHTIDEVVNCLDLASLYACWSEGGRGFYDPSMMLKVLFFAYCDGEHHSRDIAKKIKYDVRYQYFAGSLRPAHNTICRFRNIDVDLLASYFVRIVSVCNEMGLLDSSLLAIDGTKIKASASGKRTLRRKDLDLLKEKYKEILSADAASDIEDVGGDDDIDGDVSESVVEPVSRRDLKARIGKAMKRLAAGAREVNLTDNDARFMKTSDGGIRPSYNGQIAVDKNQIIVAVDVSSNADDSPSFQSMVEQISEVYQHERAMKKKLSSVEGRAVYDRRKVMVEPVFGNIKFNLGFRQFVLRGLKKAKVEFLLMCIAHNLKKMSRSWTHLKPSRRQNTAINKRIFSYLSLFFVVLRKLAICRINSNIRSEYA